MRLELLLDATRPGLIDHGSEEATAHGVLGIEASQFTLDIDAPMTRERLTGGGREPAGHHDPALLGEHQPLGLGDRDPERLREKCYRPGGIGEFPRRDPDPNRLVGESQGDAATVHDRPPLGRHPCLDPVLPAREVPPPVHLDDLQACGAP